MGSLASTRQLISATDAQIVRSIAKKKSMHDDSNDGYHIGMMC